MTWHRGIEARATKFDMWLIINKAWQHIDNIWPEFIVEPINVILGLAIDGVNPFGEKNNT